MSQKSGLAAVLAAITGKQPAGDSIARADHMTAIEAAVTQAFGEGETAGKLTGTSEAATAERGRIKGIMGGENAKGRETLAAHFAFDTSMSVDDANAALAAGPKADAKGGSRLDALMPGNTPGLKEPGATNDSGADLGAALSGAVDTLVKQRGMSAH